MRVSDAHSFGLTRPSCRGWRKIHANLADRLQEAKQQGWMGEVAAIETTMAAAAQKLEAMRTARNRSVHLGTPDVRLSAGRSNSRAKWR
jgi:hypothetical protein